MKLAHSPITQHTFNGRQFLLKRDDQLHPEFSGNKARKFAWLLNHEFANIDTLIGYGSAQANSLYSLAALAKLKGWQCEFYVTRIPSWLKAKPTGNYGGALKLGANIIETGVDNCEDYIQQVRKPAANCLCVPEGGRFQWAEYGVKQLADELVTQLGATGTKRYVVALPSGTGTTALYLHKALANYDIEVITCPCVGGEGYLRDQFQSLGEKSHPHILELDNKHHFGKLYRQDYEIWQALLNQTQVEFDLLYDPMMWQCLEAWLSHHSDRQLVYIHQGGLLGNQSMLPRYERKYAPTSL
ncbi:pyridoxal-phosphate dependent enzyme [Vibrio xiamenensis]|nr:pyridoxal-phosphate dependent enzyme [Vibrio xiamenensis]